MSAALEERSVFIDSHAHLEGHKFDSDRAEVFSRARAAGLERILAIGSGTGPGTLDCAIKIAEQHDWIFATLGIHPHEAKLAGESDYSEMKRLAKHPKIMAWGEIGLDYFYDHSPRDVQKEVFRRQMEQARSARLPIIIHCRPSTTVRTPGMIRFTCSASTGLRAVWAASCTASPASGSTRKPRWTWGSTSRSPVTLAFRKPKTFARPPRRCRLSAC